MGVNSSHLTYFFMAPSSVLKLYSYSTVDWSRPSGLFSAISFDTVRVYRFPKISQCIGRPTVSLSNVKEDPFGLGQIPYFRCIGCFLRGKSCTSESLRI